MKIRENKYKCYYKPFPLKILLKMVFNVFFMVWQNCLVKYTSYWFLLIFKKYIILFKMGSQSRSRDSFKGFLMKNQKKF